MSWGLSGRCQKISYLSSRARKRVAEQSISRRQYDGRLRPATRLGKQKLFACGRDMPEFQLRFSLEEFQGFRVCAAKNDSDIAQGISAGVLTGFRRRAVLIALPPVRFAGVSIEASDGPIARSARPRLGSARAFQQRRTSSRKSAASGVGGINPLPFLENCGEGDNCGPDTDRDKVFVDVGGRCGHATHRTIEIDINQ